MDSENIEKAGDAAWFIFPFQNELKELQEKQETIIQQLETQRLTDLGKSVLYKQLTEVLKEKETIYKKQLENLKNGH